MCIDSRKNGRRERRLARVIAHYNFSAMLPKLWALPRGWALPRPSQGSAPTPWQGLSLCASPAAFGITKMNFVSALIGKDFQPYATRSKSDPLFGNSAQRPRPLRTLSRKCSSPCTHPLGTPSPKPLKPFIKYSKTSWQKYHVSTSSRATLAAARRITDAQSNIWLTSTRMMSISAET